MKVKVERAHIATNDCVMPCGQQDVTQSPQLHEEISYRDQTHCFAPACRHVSFCSKIRYILMGLYGDWQTFGTSLKWLLGELQVSALRIGVSLLSLGRLSHGIHRNTTTHQNRVCTYNQSTTISFLITHSKHKYVHYTHKHTCMDPHTQRHTQTLIIKTPVINLLSWKCGFSYWGTSMIFIRMWSVCV